MNEPQLMTSEKQTNNAVKKRTWELMQRRRQHTSQCKETIHHGPRHQYNLQKEPPIVRHK